MNARRTVMVAVTLALTFAPVLALAQGGTGQGMGPGERGGMAPGSGQMHQMQQMQGMMQQIQGMMQQMAKMMQGGSMTPEQMKRMGQLLEQMSGMMGGMQDMMGGMGGRGGSPQMMGEMSQMMERTAEMQKHMAETMGAPQRGGAAEGPGGVKQAVGGGGVTVEVTWLKEAAGAPSFRVILDTHSVNLDGYRFEEIVRLRDGRGGEQAPAAVEGVEGSGHHRQATVRFSWPEPKPGELEVVVKGVAGVPERVFRWSVQ